MLYKTKRSEGPEVFVQKIAMILALLACQALGFVSSAQAQHMNSPTTGCTQVVTVDLANCLHQNEREADRELNELYRRIMGVLDDEDRALLVEAQRAWIAYRDKSCAAVRAMYGRGSASGSAVSACLLSITRQRIDALRIGYLWRVEKLER